MFLVDKWLTILMWVYYLDEKWEYVKVYIEASRGNILHFSFNI